jgi:hypothetical protein
VIIVCLISFIFQASELSAQTKNKREKEITPQTEGIKKASQPNVRADNTNSRKNTAAYNSINTDPTTNDEGGEMLQGIHFDQLPESVKHRIEANKVGGKPIMEGIAKGYLVKVNDCNSREECKSLLNFLLENKEAQDIQAVNDFSFHLIVATNQRSETLKEQLLNRGVRFSFVEEFYLLK